MKIDLSDKTAIVTGSGGIGLASATGLANAGARVTLVGRTQERVDAALVKLRDASGRDDASAVVAGVGNAEGCNVLIAAATPDEPAVQTLD